MFAWQYLFKPVRHSSGAVLIRAQIRNLSQPHRDLDINSDFARATNLDPEQTLAKARSFIRELGFRFPVPIKPPAALTILSLHDFPTYQQWQEVFPGESIYSPKDYHEDLNLFFQNTMMPSSHKALAFRLRRTAQLILAKRSDQDRAIYAREFLKSFTRDRAVLDNFYGTVVPLSDEAEAILYRLEEAVRGYTPVQKQTKKQQAHPDQMTDIKKGGRKKKVVDVLPMGAIWDEPPF